MKSLKFIKRVQKEHCEIRVMNESSSSSCSSISRNDCQNVFSLTKDPNHNTEVIPMLPDDNCLNQDADVGQLSKNVRYVYMRDDTQGWMPVTISQQDGTSVITPNLPGVVRQEEDGRESSTLVALVTKEEEFQDLPPRSKPKDVTIRSYNNVKKKKALGKTVHNANQELPLQCVDDHGKLILVDNLGDLPYLHEASILFNLKERYEKHGKIYTRVQDKVWIAINPYKWIKGIYSDDKRLEYAQELVWNRQGLHSRSQASVNSKSRSKVSAPAAKKLDPHLYEVSSLAMREVQMDEQDQTIIVSGESGSGKTTASKIIMSHLATFHELKNRMVYVSQIPDAKVCSIADDERKGSTKEVDSKKYLVIAKDMIERLATYMFFQLYPFGKFRVKEGGGRHILDSSIPEVNENDIDNDLAPPVTEHVQGEPEEMNQTNLIVQRVLDANPLLEAFGNAKTQWNDNSSRFSKHTKLQFHVRGDGSSCNIAGSICETFLLEKSRVASRGNKERTFHILYQLMEANEEQKIKIWPGLVGKDASSFRYIGENLDVDLYTNYTAFQSTIAALTVIGIQGDTLNNLLRSLCCVIQLGNISFDVNPENPDGSIVSESTIYDLEALSELLGVDSGDISSSFTFKTVSVSEHDTYKVPLNTAAAHATRDAFAKEIYSTTFEWLVQRTNDATCATKNYMFASEKNNYRHIAALDLFGFECHDQNGFEQLLINHANERLQKSFTDTFIDAVTREYDAEGVAVERIEHTGNDAILTLLEGKVGLMSLLNEECIRPQGCDKGFVNKLYSTLKSSCSDSALIKKRNYDLSPTHTLFGIRHFARTVDYDALDFVGKNRDTLAEDILLVASKSTNNIVSLVSESYRRTSVSKRKGCLVGTSLWTKFGKQMQTLFTQMQQTRTTYVRCILPNTQKKQSYVDPVCTINQLRSVGILSAIKMSHTFPEKQTPTKFMERYWPLLYKRKGCEDLWTAYVFSSFPSESMNEGLKRDCETLLSSLFSLSMQVSKFISKGSKTPFVVGKTTIYFRSGGVESLEAELSETFNTCATIIQGAIRRFLEKRYDKFEDDAERNYLMRLKDVIITLPLNICSIFLGLFRPQPKMIIEM